MSRRHKSDDEFEEAESRAPRRSEDDTRSSKRRSKKRRRWPLLVLLLVAGLFFLPNMIGWFGLQQRAIDYALSDFNGTVSVDSVSLGWLQPIKLTNVTAVDPNGNKIFEVADVTSSNRLYSFLTSSDLGQFDVQQPIAYLQLRPDGSNLEDALAKYISTADPQTGPDPNAKPAAALPKLIVNITNGQAVVSTTSSAQIWQIDGLNAITQIGSADAPLVVDVQCRVTPSVLDQNGQPVLQDAGGLAFTSYVDAGRQVLNFSSADLVLETENLPLSLAAPVLQRFIGPASTTGTMHGKIQAAYDGQNGSVALDVEQLSLAGFGIVAPELIGSDQVMIDNISAQGILQVSPKIIAAQQFKVESDVGKVQADGSFDINQLTNLASGGQLLDTPFQMDGEIDLAKLVRMLPTTLQLHKDLVINSGTVTFQAGSRNENGIRRMVVNLDTANISAQRGGQNIDWAKPLRLVGTIQDSQGQLALQDIRCESDFLTLVGSADMQTGSFVARGDLDKLMQRIEQFADLPDTKLAGVLDGKFGWQVDLAAAQDAAASAQSFPIQIGGNFNIANPVIEMPGMPRWQQPQMSVKLTAAGLTDSGNTLQLDQGGFQIDIGSEQIVARLAQPVADAFTNAVWNTECQLTGSMAGWLRHIQNFVDLGDVSAGGQLNLTCIAVMNAQNITFSNVQYEVDQLEFDGYAMKIREPKAVGDGTAIYHLATGNVTIPVTTISGQSLSARGQDIEITYPGNMRIDGNVAFNADVNRVAAWYELSPTQDSIFWYGGIQGTLQLASNENGIGGLLNSTITDLIAAQQVNVAPQNQPAPNGQTIQASQTQRQWQEVWREPKVGLSGTLSLANDFNAFGFQNLRIDSPSLKVSANGSIAELATAMLADISGTWRPSWEKINSLMQAYTGGLLKFGGSGEHQFVMRGPIYESASQLPGQPTPWVSPSLRAAAGFGWEQGEILGLEVGPSKMEMSLDQSVAYLKTNGIPFAGGLVQIAPRIDMRGESPMLTMEQTRIIDNVTLQPETARQWLKYVAPLVADATSAQGNFSVDVTSATVPVFNPMKMEVQGAVSLNNVVVGAGPTAEQLIGTIKQLRAVLKPGSSDRDLNTWIQMSQQTVPVVVKDGRVFHERLKFSHKDIVIQTRGSVGLDQTLNMIAEIPIVDDWIAGKSYLAGLQGQSITIPVTGTVSRPVLDKRAVQQLSQDLVKQAAGSVINDQVNQQRDKLLGKFGEKLGLPAATPPNQPAGQPGSTTPPVNPPSLQEQLQNKAQGELIKGIGNLFGK